MRRYCVSVLCIIMIKMIMIVIILSLPRFCSGLCIMMMTLIVMFLMMMMSFQEIKNATKKKVVSNYSLNKSQVKIKYKFGGRMAAYL